MGLKFWKWIGIIILLLAVRHSDSQRSFHRTPFQLNDFHAVRRPYFDDRDVYVRPSDLSFFTSDQDPFWQQFFQVYNYNGPLHNENPAFPAYGVGNEYPSYEPHSPPAILYKAEHARPNYISPIGTPQASSPPRNVDRQDEAYSRYRDYFYRRYGTNFVDELRA